jgi:hypothetical protein
MYVRVGEENAILSKIVGMDGDFGGVVRGELGKELENEKFQLLIFGMC